MQPRMQCSNLAAVYPQVAHPNVERYGLRSLEHLPRYLASPLHAPTIDAFKGAEAWLQGLEGRPPVILDSGCGTGRSTCMLARAHPDAAIIGLDRSEARLEASAQPLPPNALLVRAECSSFWRLLLQRDVEGAGRSGLSAARVRHHFLLYPNPYPKAARLNLRWHGHPALPVLCGLGGTLEIRSNWNVYLNEFLGAARSLTGTANDAVQLAVSRWPKEEEEGGAQDSAATAAARLCASRLSARGVAMNGHRGRLLTELPPLRHEDDALTLFERKFHLQGERLYRLQLP